MRVRSPLLLLAAVLGAAATPAVAPAVAGVAATAPRVVAARPAASAVGVAVREFRLAPYRDVVPAGNVRFNLTNYGEDRHDLVVRDRAGRVLARSPEVRAGERVVVRARLRPGTYRLSCDVADHASLGMRATLRVRKRAAAGR